MKTIRFKTYSPTYHLPASLKRTVKYSELELQPLCELLFQEVRGLELQAEHFQKIIDAQAAEIDRLEGINRGKRDAFFDLSSEKVAEPKSSVELLESELAVSDPGIVSAPINRRGQAWT